ncbi:MAG: hypothetical protein AAGI66_06400 [Cyanobacteria bacterium P01_H01_bin.74]
MGSPVDQLNAIQEVTRRSIGTTNTPELLLAKIEQKALPGISIADQKWIREASIIALANLDRSTIEHSSGSRKQLIAKLPIIPVLKEIMKNSNESAEVKSVVLQSIGILNGANSPIKDPNLRAILKIAKSDQNPPIIQQLARAMLTRRDNNIVIESLNNLPNQETL